MNKYNNILSCLNSDDNDLHETFTGGDKPNPERKNDEYIKGEKDYDDS